VNLLLLCGEKFPPHYAFLDTVYAQLLPARGHRITWVMPARGQRRAFRAVRWHGCTVWLVPALEGRGLFALVGHYARQAALLARLGRHLLRRARFDAVFTRDDPTMGLAAAWLARAWRVPCLFQLSHLKEEQMLAHAIAGEYGGRWKNLAKGGIGLVLRQLAMRLADLVLPMSAEMGRYLTRLAVPSRRLEVLREGADTRLDPESVTPATVPGGPVLVYAGTMSRFRRLEFLFPVLARVRRVHPDARLVMVGDGPGDDELAFLKGEAARAGVAEAVHWTGRVPRAQVPRWLAAAAVGLCPFPPHPVLLKNCPIKPMEYLAMRLPVVVSDTPELRLLVESSGGGLVVEHRADRFAEAVLALLADPARGREMGERGRDWVVAHRSLEVSTTRVEACLAKARALRQS